MLIAVLLLQAAPAACPATNINLPPALAGWTTPARALAPGRAVVLTPVDARSVLVHDIRLPDAPGKVAFSDFTVAAPGTYGLALDQKAWIDVFAAGKAAPLTSTAHGHGPACSTIRKIVRYTLAPGRYRVAVSRIEQPAARLMLVADDR